MDEQWPSLFWIVVSILCGLTLEAMLLKRPWTRTALMTYSVVALWYLGDFVQTGPEEFIRLFGRDRVEWAFYQICVFLVAFRVFAPPIARKFAPINQVTRYDPDVPLGQYEGYVFGALAVAWILLTMIGLIRIRGDYISMFFPILAENPQSPWGRSSVGSGLMDAFVSVGEYSHLAIGGMLGVVAVLASKPRVRAFAWPLFALVLMPYMFQHARHRALAVLAPPGLALAVVKRMNLSIKIVLIVILIVLVQSWFIFMTEARSGQRKWTEITIQDFLHHKESKKTALVGLDMMQELCHTGNLMDEGRYNPGFCEEYLEQAVLWVPRSLWPDKPLAGITYSIARGFYNPRAANLVFATMCPGLIGQGVANCGGYLGPVAAAMLSALWAGLLTRMWQQRDSPERLALFLVGLALTVNMGRGFSLLALFPFAFAFVIVRIAESGRSRASLTDRS